MVFVLFALTASYLACVPLELNCCRDVASGAGPSECTGLKQRNNRESNYYLTDIVHFWGVLLVFLFFLSFFF